MIRKCIRGVTWLLLGVLALVLVTGGVTAWRLYRGPVEAAFLKPYIEKALASDTGDYTVRIDATRLFWSKRTQSLRIRANKVVLNRPDGARLAAFPKISVQLGLRQLLTGSIAIKTVTLHQPDIRLKRLADGQLSVDTTKKGPSESHFLAGLLDGMSAGGENSWLISNLKTIEVVSGRARIDDSSLKRVWNTRNLNAVFRRGRKGLSGSLEFDLDIGERSLHFSSKASYDQESKRYKATVSFKRLDPALFASARGLLRGLRALEMPLSGRFFITLDRAGRPIDGAFDMDGTAGTINVPAIYARPLSVRGVHLSGKLSNQGRVLVIKRLWVDLGSAVAAMTGRFDGSDTAFRFKGGVSITRFPAGDLRALWPDALSPNGKAWVAQNIDGGMIDYLSADFVLEKLREGNQPLKLSSLDGRFAYRGLGIRFLRGLPPLSSVTGTAFFNPTGLHFKVRGGRLERTRLRNATVDFTDFDKPFQKIKVVANVEGRLSRLLTIVNRKPLEFARKLGVNPLKISGNASVRLQTSFKLLKSITMKQIDIGALVSIRKLGWGKAFFGLDLTAGNFKLDIKKAGFRMKGKARLAGEAATIQWHERFGNTKKYRRRFEINTKFVPKRLAASNLDIQSFMTGSFGAKLKISSFDDGRNLIDGIYDLRRADFTIPILNIRKRAGVAASGRSLIVLRNQRVRSVKRFELKSPVITTSGNAEFHADGKTIRVMNIRNLVSGKTRAAATISGPASGSKVIVITGQSLDLSSVKPNKNDAKKEPPKPYRIKANINRLILGKDRVLNAVNGAARNNGTEWTFIDLSARVGQDAPVRLRFVPDGKGTRLTMRSTDGGSALRVLGLVDTIKGGTLNLSAFRAGRGSRRPFIGKLVLQKFRVAKAPAVARLFAAARRTDKRGRVDKGVDLAHLEVPFQYNGDKIVIRGARAFSPEIGVTFSGLIDRKAKRLRVNGTFVPAYALNSIFGKLPVIGRLLAPEKGGGLFAAAFTLSGPMSSPNVTVNPLSALTPGFLRKIFDIGRKPVKSLGAPEKKPPRTRSNSVPGLTPGDPAPQLD